MAFFDASHLRDARQRAAQAGNVSMDYINSNIYKRVFVKLGFIEKLEKLFLAVSRAPNP